MDGAAVVGRRQEGDVEARQHKVARDDLDRAEVAVGRRAADEQVELGHFSDHSRATSRGRARGEGVTRRQLMDNGTIKVRWREKSLRQS